MSKSKNVLMIGGPADGRWMVADGYDIIVAEMPETDWAAMLKNPSPAFDLRQVRYHVQRCHMFDVALDVAVAEGEFRSSRERDKAVIRALFQRDVAEAMGAFK